MTNGLAGTRTKEGGEWAADVQRVDYSSFLVN